MFTNPNYFEKTLDPIGLNFKVTKEKDYSWPDKLKAEDISNVQAPRKMSGLQRLPGPGPPPPDLLGQTGIDMDTNEEERPTWDNQWEFMLSCISMSVGLGNVWRFPVTAYENGGGAFLIPYFIVLVFIGRPIYFLELCLGQFTSRNQIQVWRCVPFLKGIALAVMLGAMSVLTYYCSILALPVYYFINSFKNPLPWADCNEKWAGEGNCNGSILKPGLNQSHHHTLPELYFDNEVLKAYDNIDHGIGTPDWKLSLCLVFSWLVVFFSIMKGVRSSGKAAYFTAIFPYVVLIILLIRGVTLPGAGDGIMYFIKPNWHKLYEPSVWYAAARQCFFSLNTGTGSIIMFASYNPLHYNIYRDSFLFACIDTLTSLLAGLTTFAVLGSLSHELEINIDEIVEGGVGLAFISYPDAISKMGWAPQLFAVLFFMMLFTLGLGSATALAVSITSVFCDRYPHFREWMVTLAICILGCCIGLVYCTPGGQFILDLVDYFGVGIIVYTMSILEVVGVAWCYGLYNFISDMEFMLGMRLGWYWKICWGLLIPIFGTIVLVYSLVMEKLEHNGVGYPPSAIACGWLIAVAATGCLVAGAVHAMCQISAVSWLDKLKMSFKPRYDWGPRAKKNREEWQIFISSQDRRTFLRRIKDRSGI